MMRRLYLTVLFIVLSAGLIYLTVRLSKSESKPRTSGAMKALTFWNRSRAYPEPDISPTLQYKAFNAKKLLSKTAFSADDSVSAWRTMGPHNVPGRMISLAVNPQNSNTLYAGSASGGLWRTYHATTGDGWHRIRTGYPVLGVMAVCVDIADTNTVYIGTGEVYGYQRSIGGTVIRTTRGSYGIGIMKSTDSGKSWTKSLDWSSHQERGIQCIRMNPENPRSLFAATSEGIYKTTDAGATWEMVYPVLMAQDIVIHHQDTTKVMVSCGNLGSPGSGIYRSLDGGKNWTRVTGIPSFSGKTLICAYGNNPDLVFASVADSLQGRGLYRTDNFGVSWTLMNLSDVPQYQGWFSHWVAVKPTDSMQVVQAGVYLFKSTDGGNTLSQVNGPHVDHHNFTIDPSNPNVLYIACDGGVYRSTTFGSSYQNIGYGLQTAQFYNGFSSSHSDSMLAMGGLQDNNTVIFDGTMDWHLVIGGDGCWTAINSFNDNILYGEYQYNNIYKSTNRGASFSSAINGITQSDAAFVSPYVISESNPSVLYTGRRTIFKTTDGADSWFPTNGGGSPDDNYVLSLAVSPEDPDVVYAGTAPIYSRAHIFRSLDGDTWEDVTQDLPDRYPMDIAIDPNDKNTVYVVFSGFGSGHVFKSTNAGEDWSDISGSLPDVPTMAISVDPLNSDHVYIGNDLGVFVSTDGGSAWTAFNKGLPETVIAMDVAVSPANRHLRVATHGNGAYQRPLLYQPAVFIASSLTPFPQTIISGHEISFGAQVTNYGNLDQVDTVYLELRVLDQAAYTVFQSFQSAYNLKAGETAYLSFEEPFVPSDSGSYTVELTIIDSETKTLQYPLRVILSPSIALAEVTKEYHAYEEVTDGINLPKGDDIQREFALPFDFIYDGYTYDKIQISTNGWMELGTGAAGTERGISTATQIGQIGANENGRLASTARPSKALGPWWEDLNTDITGTTGQVSLNTLGTKPFRTCVVQWKNMRAYFDITTTTRVNFQARLYEGTNRIEYHYGPVVKGTFAGDDIGAMIGFKDHMGGDYHYFDVASGESGLSGDIITNLSPLTDWPGPDSMYVIQTSTLDIASQTEPVLQDFTLLQNYPNPFNGETVIRYSVGTRIVGARLQEPLQPVELTIYNLLGQKITTLVSETQPVGEYRIKWDGTKFASGVYLYRLKTGNNIIQTRKLMLLK